MHTQKNTRTQDHAALITGASRRIGRAIALHFAQKGHPVILHYHRRKEAATEFCASLRADGTPAYILQADLASKDGRADLIERARQLTGSLAFLINNASLFEKDGPEDIHDPVYAAHMAVNLQAPLALSAAFYRLDSPLKDRCIVHLLDMAVARPSPRFFSYRLSRAALHAVIPMQAQYFSAKHVRVNAVAPGPTLPSPRQKKSDFERLSACLPLRSGPDPAEIAQAVYFLCSSPSATGQTLVIDGGRCLEWKTPDFFVHE